MRLSSFRYALRDALRSLWRNKYMGLASMATVAVSLLILGCAWILVLNADYLAKTMESELEINVYLKSEVTPDQVLVIKSRLNAISGVGELAFIPKEDGLKSLQERMNATDLEQALGGKNPLPDMFRIKASDANLVPEIAKKAEGIAGVERVRYGQGMVEKLLSLTNWLRTIGLVAIIAVSLAAVFLIATSIRLTVFARRREINIMKLVGATNWYIRWPFFLEGMLIGLMGALIAVLGLYFFYGELVKNIALTVSFLPIITDTAVLYQIYKILLLGGALLGAIGSAISLRRFLKV